MVQLHVAGEAHLEEAMAFQVAGEDLLVGCHQGMKMKAGKVKRIGNQKRKDGMQKRKYMMNLTKGKRKRNGEDHMIEDHMAHLQMVLLEKGEEVFLQEDLQVGGEVILAHIHHLREEAFFLPQRVNPRNIQRVVCCPLPNGKEKSSGAQRRNIGNKVKNGEQKKDTLMKAVMKTPGHPAATQAIDLDHHEALLGPQGGFFHIPMGKMNGMNPTMILIQEGVHLYVVVGEVIHQKDTCGVEEDL